MAFQFIEDTGTVSVDNGSTTVIGTNTAFVTKAVQNGLIIIGGIPAVIESVESETSLTLAAPWPSAGVVDGAYVIHRSEAYASEMILANERLSDVITRFTSKNYVEWDAAGTALSDRDQYDDEAKDFRFAVVPPPGSTGYATVYEKLSATSGDWSGGIQVQGPEGADGTDGLDGTDGVQGTGISDIVALTESEYAALDPKSASTFYIVSEDG